MARCVRRPMNIPFLDLSVEAELLHDELMAAAERVIQTGRYLLGSEVEAFEKEFAHAIGVQHCIGVGNGLDALRLALEARNIGPGDEVIVPANTFIATWLAVSASGATPVPIDPDPITLTIDGTGVAAALTDQTAAVIPVHLYGSVSDMSSILAATEGREIFVLEDAAQAHGAASDTGRAGALGNAGAFSFYPSKNLGALGDGGALTTNDEALAERVRMLGNYGSRSKYRHEYPGSNSRLDELQAAFLRVKLQHLEFWNGQRERLAEQYITGLSNIVGLTLPPPLPLGFRSSWYVFIIHHGQRDAMQLGLSTRGVNTQVYYPIPPHLSRAYAHLGFRRGDFPVAEHSAKTNLALPLSPHLSTSVQEMVIDTVRSVAQDLAQT